MSRWQEIVDQATGLLVRSLSLNIAGYIIRFESVSEDISFVPSKRFLRNISAEADHEVLIKVHDGKTNLPAGAKKFLMHRMLKRQMV